MRILFKKGAYVDKGGDGRLSDEIRKQLRLFKTAGATRAEVEFLLEEVYAESPGKEGEKEDV